MTCIFLSLARGKELSKVRTLSDSLVVSTTGQFLVENVEIPHRENRCRAQIRGPSTAAFAQSEAPRFDLPAGLGVPGNGNLSPWRLEVVSPFPCLELRGATRLEKRERLLFLSCLQSPFSAPAPGTPTYYPIPAYPLTIPTRCRPCGCQTRKVNFTLPLLGRRAQES